MDSFCVDVVLVFDFRYRHHVYALECVQAIDDINVFIVYLVFEQH